MFSIFVVASIEVLSLVMTNALPCWLEGMYSSGQKQPQFEARASAWQ